MRFSGSLKRFNNLLTIDKQFSFKGQLDELHEILRNSKDINYELLSERELRFTPDISWGTLRISGGVSFGIYLKATLKEQDCSSVKINFKTNIRPEHYFIIAVFIFFFVGVIFSGESMWLFHYVLVLWIILHCWFQFIIRLQENYLLERIVKRLSC